MRVNLKLFRLKEKNILSGELFTVSLLSIVSVLGFARITTKLVQNKLNPFMTDIKVMEFLSAIQSPQLTSLMKVFTSFCSVHILPWFAGALAFKSIRRETRRIKSFDIPVVATGSALLNLLFKARFRRTRPGKHAIKVSGWSYPSGHAMEGMSFYGLLIYYLIRKKKSRLKTFSLGTLLSLLIFLIGVSRSYLRVHYPSDVVAGYALGFLWLTSSLCISRGTEYLLLKRREDWIDSVQKKIKSLIGVRLLGS